MKNQHIYDANYHMDCSNKKTGPDHNPVPFNPISYEIPVIRRK